MPVTPPLQPMTPEIAEKLDYSVGHIERRVSKIKQVWLERETYFRARGSPVLPPVGRERSLSSSPNELRDLVSARRASSMHEKT